MEKRQVVAQVPSYDAKKSIYPDPEPVEVEKVGATTTIYTTQLPSSSDLLTTYDITTGRGFFVFPLLPSFPFLPFIFVRSFVRSVSPSPPLPIHTYYTT